MIGGRSAAPILAPVLDTDPCQIVYTSGATGRPKGAVLSHGNVLRNYFNTIFAREDPAGEKILIVGPLFHVAPLNNQMIIHLGLAGTCVFIRKFEPESVLQTIQREMISVMVAAPAVYNLMMTHPNARRYDTRSIRHLTSGADRLLAETRKNILEFFEGVNGVYNAYGCTEATATIAVLKAGDSMKKGESVGKPAPFLEARVIGDDGEPLQPGEVGEVVCRGPNVMQRYFNRPEATAEAIRDGWLHTGDLAYRDEEGYFYIVDRKKDMVVSGGENVYPREVEDVLLRHPDILDTAVVGVPDPLWGESVKAFVVKRPGSSVSAEDVIDYCKSQLAGYKKPRFVAFLAEIPRNPAGKALKTILRQR